MSTHTQTLYQIIFSTKYREKTLKAYNRKELFKSIWGILKNKNCHLYQIGGVDDHIHIVMHLRPSVALAGLIKNIKLAATEYIKNRNIASEFQWMAGWICSIYIFN